MTRLFIIGMFLTLIYSCSNKTKGQRTTDVDSQDISASKIYDKPDTIDFKGEDIRISETALSFYKWYIDYENGKDSSIILGISKGENGKCTLENMDKYLGSLKSIGTLTNDFIDTEKSRLLKCKIYLQSYDWDKFSSSTIYEVTDDTPCSCFTTNYWFQSQESVDEAGIIKYKKNNNALMVDIAFFTNDDYGRHQQYFYAIEHLVKINKNWFIDKIDVKIK